MMRKNNQTILPETNIELYINYASVLKEKAYKRTNTEVGFPKHKNKKNYNKHIPYVKK